ncbi:transmembrane protein, putative (macronuclear) [Tetrahymena thermophila SB210]|uniref:Transmembrane protein, putative n=1 Tax=Tetrahymena thermophila (strain SB210) TaxID=312017 RepID=W7XLN4_TETTS|nr:transmembrane protein, putative [Tetrahymena thermophila SB210]EWS76594.1 transmembrane protein, putative [Tetrahymena thermophila SB210]|eukprot:XP_012650880.1 transmembrane protein, putative [Tetrahymena thermophila SB210]
MFAKSKQINIHKNQLIFGITLQIYYSNFIQLILQLQIKISRKFNYKIGLISCFHHQKHSFNKLDHLSDRISNLASVSKNFLILFCLILINQIQSKYIFIIFPFLLSVTEIVKFWISFSYIDQLINRLFLFLNFFNLLTSILILVFLKTNISVSIFQQILIVAVLAYKISEICYDYKVEKIKNFFQSQNKTKQIPSYALDFLIRDLAQKQKSSQLSSFQIHDHKNEIIENEIIASHIKNCTKSPYCHCDKMKMVIQIATNFQQQILIQFQFIGNAKQLKKNKL